VPGEFASGACGTAKEAKKGNSSGQSFIGMGHTVRQIPALVAIILP
jgi:glycine cleavage system pyridoxal-binding protein P